jgi:3-hydroxyisobutyrate dehydrogenase-like beta-hydroxyacid dehydrogenase
MPTVSDTQTRSFPKIGLLGLGLMGQAIAERLIAAGFSVFGFDISQEATVRAEKLGVRVVKGIDELACHAQWFVLSLTDHESVLRVIDTLEPLLSSGALIVDTTTGAPEVAEQIAQRLRVIDVGFVDASISGSSEQLRRGESLIMAGGSVSDCQRCTDLFHSLAHEWIHVGASGSGMRMKLVTNLVLGLNRAALAEGLVLADELRLDRKATLETLRRSMAYSRIMDTKGIKMIERDFEPQARLSQHLKDVRLIQRSSTVSLPLTETHRQLLEKAEAMGFGDRDNSAIIMAITGAETTE